MVSVSSKSITKSRCQGETQTKKTGYPVACTVVTLLDVIVKTTYNHVPFILICLLLQSIADELLLQI